MTYIELPLWFVIVWTVMIVLVMLYLTFGDFLAKLFYKLLKEKFECEEQEDKKGKEDD